MSVSFIQLLLQRQADLLEEASLGAEEAQSELHSTQSALTSAGQQLADATNELANSDAKVRQPYADFLFLPVPPHLGLRMSDLTRTSVHSCLLKSETFCMMAGR